MTDLGDRGRHVPKHFTDDANNLGGCRVEVYAATITVVVEGGPVRARKHGSQKNDCSLRRSEKIMRDRQKKGLPWSSCQKKYLGVSLLETTTPLLNLFHLLFEALSYAGPWSPELGGPRARKST